MNSNRGLRGFHRFLVQTQINTDFHRLLKYDLEHEESEEDGVCIEIPHFVRNDNFRWGKTPPYKNIFSSL
jgi:hypothetical protein